tara:strand:- start:166 stop:744 length:579 start_codon:yes stop_codon:yes gene_type:complete
MGFLDNSSITVDAILTQKGRQRLAKGQPLDITKFALSDEEIDYTLYDTAHPSGTDSFGIVIENMNLLEAFPNRTGFRSYLIDDNMSGATLTIDSYTYGPMLHSRDVTIKPGTDTIDEMYEFSIDNINIVRFNVAGFTDKEKYVGSTATLITQKINAARTAIVTVRGVDSGLSKTVSITVKKADNGKDPDKLD